MAQDRDELNKRRAAREAKRKQREAAERRMKIRLIFVSIALVACIGGIFLLTKDVAPAEGESTPTVPVETTAPETTVPPTQSNSRNEQPTSTVIHIKAAGDLNITDKTVASADTDLGYDYTRPFLDVAHLLTDADLTLMNFNGNISGEPYGTETMSAPSQLLDALRSYCGVKPCYLVVVFDGYRVKGSRGSQEKLGDVQVVYTGENETADSYIEALAARIGGNYAVRVVSSDALVQLSSFRSGVLRMSARELREEVELARKEMKNILGNRFQSDE